MVLDTRPLRSGELFIDDQRQRTCRIEKASRTRVRGHYVDGQSFEFSRPMFLTWFSRWPLETDVISPKREGTSNVV